MILPALALALALALAQPPETPPTLLPPAEVADRMAACGFPRADVTSKFDDIMQEDIIAIRASNVSDQQLGCVVDATFDTSYYAYFDGDVNQRYWTLWSEKSQAASLIRSRAWLVDHQLMDSLPHFDPAHDELAAFAIKLERLCGARPRSTLEVDHDMLTISKRALERDMRRPSALSPHLECLMHAAEVAAVPIGFIGNEVAAE